MHKVSFYGIRGTTYTWIRDFLSGRTQQVVVDGVGSDSGQVKSGVPQDTVLGPLLFQIFINDIADELHSTVRLYADDCLLYRQISTEADAKRLEEDLTTLCAWTKRWQMAFNVSKCMVVTFKSPRKRKWIKYHYKMLDQLLSRPTDTPYLGVTLGPSTNGN